MCNVFTNCPALCFAAIRSTHCFVLSPFWPLVGVLVFGRCLCCSFFSCVVLSEINVSFFEFVSLGNNNSGPIL